jgi:peptidoglycan DL-endopeptidase CwlO
MSVTDVTARIQQIQSQLAILQPIQATGAAAFSSALSKVTATGTAGDPSGNGSTVTGQDVVAEAKKYIGLPYVWGGTSITKGVDCSGLVQSVYKTLGYDLPRVSADQARAGQPVASMAQAQPGDLIAWDNSSRNNGADHIAIYAGNGKMIEAPRTGLDVRLVDVPSTPDMIRQILPDNAAAASGVSGGASAGRVSAGTPFSTLFNSASAKYGVDANLLAAVAKQESGYNPKAVSPAGAQGLMQLMPATASGLGVHNSFDPNQAVDGAARLLKDLLSRFDRTDLALAAYNAGPGAVLRYDGIPPYPETQNYVRSVMSMMEAAA